MRDKTRMVDGAASKLNESLGRSPTDAEMATELGVDKRELRTLYSQVSFTSLATLDETTVSGSTLGELISDSADGPTGEFDVNHIRELLVAGIDGLRPRERTLLALYYFEGLTLTEIGTVLGVGESRACQLHVELVAQLNTAICRLYARAAPQQKDSGK